MSSPPVPAPKYTKHDSILIAKHRVDEFVKKLWSDTIAGVYGEAWYITTMSKCSFDKIGEALSERGGRAHTLRVLTLDPNLNRKALQGLVTDVFVLVEILPYGTDKRDRPALYIRLEDDKESYQTFAKAFKELWTASPELVIRESVDANTQYTQFATELRRYRDYELTAAGWFGALQIGLATVVWREPGWMLGILCANCLAQFVLAALIYILGFSGVFSVQYSKIRGRQLQQDVVNKRFPEALSGLPPAKVTPYHWIVIVLGVLPVVHVCLLAFLLHWPIYITLPSILVPLILMVGAPWAIGKFVGFIEKPNKAV